MENYIQNLIIQGEHQKLDFKFAINDARKIARSMVAFANTEGGTLLIGIKDNGVAAGVRSEEEYYMVESAAQLYCRPEIKFNCRKWIYQGKTILEVMIPKAEKLPHLAQNEDARWMAYVRVDDENILANTIQFKVWKRKHNKSGTYLTFSPKEKILLTYLETHLNITFDQFLKMAHISKKDAENVLVNLISLKIIQIKYSSKGINYNLNKDISICF